MRLLIKGGRVYTGGRLAEADVLVEDGRIAAVAPKLVAAGAQLLELYGGVVSPGFTDLHVHLRQPGFEAKETVASGTAAAAAGGFTRVCAMPNLSPVPDSPATLRPQLEAIKSAWVEVRPYGAITMGQRGQALADMAGLAPLVCGFSDDGFGVQNDELMRTAMQTANRLEKPVVAHCEVNALLPKNGTCVQENSPFAQSHGYTGHSNESEWREVERDIRLAAETGCHLHLCHLSCAESVELVRKAKAAGLRVSCEATPHNLTLSCQDITGDDGRFKMNPPLRRPQDVLALQAALLDGTIDAVATDHAPHTAADKAGGFARSANGVVGLETAFAALYTRLVMGGALPLETLLTRLTTGPAGVLGLPAPAIAPGAPANLTAIDLELSLQVDPERFLSKGRATPFAGTTLKGWPVATLYGGNIIFDRLQYL